MTEIDINTHRMTGAGLKRYDGLAQAGPRPVR